MLVTLDYSDGSVQVDLVGDGPVPLLRPSLAQWCSWQRSLERSLDVDVDVDAIEHALPGDGQLVAGPVAALNTTILGSLMTRPVAQVEPDHPLWLALCDRGFTAELLTFWRDFPLSPWVNAADDGEVQAEGGDAKLIQSALPGALGARAVLYRALAPDLAPRQVDELELWQIAVLLGRDDVPAGEGGRVERLAGDPLFDDGLDDGGRVQRKGTREVRSWRRRPGAPFLFSAGAPT